MRSNFQKTVITTFLSVLTAFLLATTASATIKYGDVDNSNEINVSDARIVLRFAVKLETPKNDDIKEAADVDDDGDIDVSDARLVLRYAVKLDTSFPAHNHTYGDFVTVKEPTCTEKGLKEKSCTICGGETIQEEIEVLGHDYSVKEKTVAPTCTAKGYDTYKCSRCTATTKKNETDAKGHTYGDYVTLKAATCTTKGSKQKTCTVCGDKVTEEIPALGHNYSSAWTIDTAATCTTAGSKSHHCTRCNDKKDITVISALGHDFSTEWTVDANATCTKDGSQSHHCSRCDEKSGVTVIPATGHDFSVDNSVFPKTADEAGTNNLYIETSPVCKTCGNVPSKDISVFNNMTNIIKNNFKYRTSHSITRIVRDDETTKCSELDFGLIWTSTIKKAMADDFGTTTTYRYSDISRIASATSLPYLQYTVSNLTNEDVSKVSYTIQDGLKASDVMSDFDDSISINSRTVKDITSKKNMTWTGKVIKMQVTVKKETFTVGSSSANDLYAKYNNDKNYKCALSRITSEINPISDAQAYNMDSKGTVVRSNYTVEESDDSMTMQMKLNSISASGTVTYYFDADTFEPLMAQYKLSETLNQRVDMQIIKIVKGYMVPVVTTDINQVYFFNENSTD